MRRAAIPALALAALLQGACGEPAATGGRPVAATLVPAGQGGSLPEPELRYPPGSRLARFDLERPAAPRRPLSEGMAAAGGASVAVDGETLAFVGRRQLQDPFGVWLADPDGGNRRRLDGAPPGAGGVAWLPDGRLVVAAPVAGPAPLAGMSSAWALFVADPEAGEARRITFGAGELDPSVLADGRILYSQWQPGGDGRPEGGGFALFTVHPDGTGASQLHGYHDGSRLKLLARQTATQDLVFLGGEGETLSLRGMDWRRPQEASYALGTSLGQPVAAEPAADGGLLVAATESGGAPGLWLVERPGSDVAARLQAPPGSRFAHAVEIARRPRPQGHLSMVDPEAGVGHLLCVDARPPRMPEAARVRLLAGAERRPLGEAPLADDGSFFAAVPPDRPLYLELLAADGRLLMSTETPIWVRPKEVRVCVGCHDSPFTGPPNRRPQAVLAQPVDLTARES